MPARTALAPGRLPERLAFLLRLPQHEIRRILLILLAGDLQLPKARLELVQVLVGQLAVLSKRAGPEIHGAVLRHIGMALVDQGLDHLQHAADLLGRLGMGGGLLHVHGRHILPALRNVALGHCIRVHPFLDGLFDDLVVHIGKVGDKIHLISLILKIPPHRVEHQHGAGVADVDVVVYGGAAYVHLHFPWGQGDKFFLGPGQCIIDLHHRFSSFFLIILSLLPASVRIRDSPHSRRTPSVRH